MCPNFLLCTGHALWLFFDVCMYYEHTDLSSLISVLLSLYSSFTGFRPLEFAYPIAELSRPSRSLELAMTNPSDSGRKLLNQSRHRMIIHPNLQ